MSFPTRMPTPEEARAELARRQSMGAQQNQQRMPTPEEARAELFRRQSIRQEARPKAIGGGDKYANNALIDSLLASRDQYVIPAIRGGAEGIAGAGASGLNLLNKLSGSHYDNLEEPNFHENMGENASPLAFGAGKFAGELAGPGGVFKALSKIPRSVGKLGLLQDLLKGGLAGYSTGEFAPGGRELSGALGAIGVPAAGSTSKAIAKKIVERKNQLQKAFGKEYDALFSKAAEAGIKPTKVPQINYAALEKELPKKHKYTTLSEFKSKPSIEGAHRAKSDLQGVSRELEAKKLSHGKLSASEKTLEQQVRSAEEKLNSYIDSNLENISPGFSEDYRALQEKYATEMVPFFGKSTGIGKYEAAKKSPEAFVKALQGESGHEFRNAAGKDFPELKLNDLKKYLKYVGAAGGGYIGIPHALRRLGLGDRDE